MISLEQINRMRGERVRVTYTTRAVDTGDLAPIPVWGAGTPTTAAGTCTATCVARVHVAWGEYVLLQPDNTLRRVAILLRDVVEMTSPLVASRRS